MYRGTFKRGVVSDIQPVEGVSRLQGGQVNFDAEISADGDTLVFVDGRFRPGNPLPIEADLVAARGPGRFVRQSSGPLALANSLQLDYAPCLSADGLELFFTRLEGGQPALFQASRSATHQPFGRPIRVAAAEGFVEGPTLSPDGRSLYYHKQENGRFRLFRVTR